MFKLVKDPVARWPVVWNSWNADGTVRPQTLMLQLVRIGREEFNASFGAGKELSPAAELDLFWRLVRGWDDLTDATGDPLPFTRENAAALLDLPGFAGAFTMAFVNYWLGLPAEREKNSAPSPDMSAAAAAPQATGAGASTATA